MSMDLKIKKKIYCLSSWFLFFVISISGHLAYMKLIQGGSPNFQLFQHIGSLVLTLCGWDPMIIRKNLVWASKGSADYCLLMTFSFRFAHNLFYDMKLSKTRAIAPLYYILTTTKYRECWFYRYKNGILYQNQDEEGFHLHILIVFLTRLKYMNTKRVYFQGQEHRAL